MAKAAKKHQPKMIAIQQTIGNLDFLGALNDALITSVNKVYRSDNPTYLPGCAGQLMYHYSVDVFANRLRKYGFVVKFHSGQLRIFSKKGFACPIYLTFAGGTVSGSTAKFNHEKGAVTRDSVLCNRINYQPIQPGLFDETADNLNVLNQLVLGVVHNVSPKHLNAWLVLGTEWIDDLRLHCPESSVICEGPNDIVTIPDILPSDDDSGYDMDFGEMMTGT